MAVKVRILVRRWSACLSSDFSAEQFPFWASAAPVPGTVEGWVQVLRQWSLVHRALLFWQGMVPTANAFSFSNYISQLRAFYSLIRLYYTLPECVMFLQIHALPTLGHMGI